MGRQPASISEMCAQPADHFGSPSELLNAVQLDREQKLAALRSWETDERLRMTATEENMAGGPPNLLRQVQACLRALELPDGSGE
jgi:hypothetical protein